MALGGQKKMRSRYIPGEKYHTANHKESTMFVPALSVP